MRTLSVCVRALYLFDYYNYSLLLCDCVCLWQREHREGQIRQQSGCCLCVFFRVHSKYILKRFIIFIIMPQNLYCTLYHLCPCLSCANAVIFFSTRPIIFVHTLFIILWVSLLFLNVLCVLCNGGESVKLYFAVRCSIYWFGC